MSFMPAVGAAWFVSAIAPRTLPPSAPPRHDGGMRRSASRRTTIEPEAPTEPLPDMSGKYDVLACGTAGVWRALVEIHARISTKRRRQFHFVMGLMVLGALLELATIGAVVPFVALLADPLRLSRFPEAQLVFGAIGAVTIREQLLATTGVFVALVLLAGVVRLQLSWSCRKFIFQTGHDIALDMLHRILLQPYSFHVARNTSNLIAALDKAGVLAFNVLLQLMQAAIAVTASVFIIAALVYVDPFAALLAAAAILPLYMLVSVLTRHHLDRNSQIAASSWSERIRIVQESLGGIRDVLIDQSHAIYLEAFRRVDLRLSTAQAHTAFIGTAPRFIIESLGMAFIAALACMVTLRHGGLAAALPIIGALALGAQRLLPFLQQIYLSWSVAVGNRSVVQQVLEFLSLPVDQEIAGAAELVPLPLQHHIRATNISFTYPGRRAPAIDELSFEIRRGECVALVGRTGSGKSTLADLLMGLLEPIAGQIDIDGVALSKDNRRNWQRSIAHVPQSIFLADTSIARNIAFGQQAGQLDLERVIDASIKARLHEFVSTLPDGYETFVGERGTRLSGGQRQRLGIARAIYKQAPVLVLDEATSALDEETELAVMRALDRLGEEGRTIIMIAHRLSTAVRVDRVIRLDDAPGHDLHACREMLSDALSEAQVRARA
jgi:ABC-type multidrug transport system fused ATPase/permease subunit